MISKSLKLLQRRSLGYMIIVTNICIFNKIWHQDQELGSSPLYDHFHPLIERNIHYEV